MAKQAAQELRAHQGRHCGCDGNAFVPEKDLFIQQKAEEAAKKGVVPPPLVTNCPPVPPPPPPLASNMDPEGGNSSSSTTTQPASSSNSALSGSCGRKHHKKALLQVHAELQCLTAQLAGTAARVRQLTEIVTCMLVDDAVEV